MPFTETLVRPGSPTAAPAPQPINQSKAPAPAVAPKTAQNVSEATGAQAKPESASEGNLEAASAQAEPVQELTLEVEEPAAQTAPNNPETPQEGQSQEAAAQETEKERYASQWAKLAAKEKRLTEQSRSLKVEREQLAQHRQTLAQQAQQIEQFRQAVQGAKQNPLQVFQALGLDWNYVQEYALAHLDEVTGTAKAPQNRELAELRQELAELKQVAKTYQEREQQREQQSIDESYNRYKADLISHIKGEPTKYEFVNLEEAYDEVFDVIVRNHEKTGQIMDRDQAASLVERYYADKYDRALKHKANRTNGTEANKGEKSNQASGLAPTITANQTGSGNPAPQKPLTWKEEEARLKERARQLGFKSKPKVRHF